MLPQRVHVVGACVVSRNRIENTLDLPGQTNRKTDSVQEGDICVMMDISGVWSAIRHPIIQTSAAGLRKEELKTVIT